uniref:Uncharacterized protein n=1 Tax=Arundo donax TaxID=35708 RepID=A0A0A9G632_ARUDO
MEEVSFHSVHLISHDLCFTVYSFVLVTSIDIA